MKQKYRQNQTKIQHGSNTNTGWFTARTLNTARITHEVIHLRTYYKLIFPASIITIYYNLQGFDQLVLSDDKLTTSVFSLFDISYCQLLLPVTLQNLRQHWSLNIYGFNIIEVFVITVKSYCTVKNSLACQHVKTPKSAQLCCICEIPMIMMFISSYSMRIFASIIGISQIQRAQCRF